MITRRILATSSCGIINCKICKSYNSHKNNFKKIKKTILWLNVLSYIHEIDAPESLKQDDATDLRVAVVAPVWESVFVAIIDS